MYFFIKILHHLGVVALLGSILTMDLVTIKLFLSKKHHHLKAYYLESPFIEKAIIGPSSVLTLLTGWLLVELGFSWSFWVAYGLVVVVFTAFTGSVFMPKLKKQLFVQTDLPLKKRKKKLFLMVFLMGLNLLLLFSTVGIMVYKPEL